MVVAVKIGQDKPTSLNNSPVFTAKASQHTLNILNFALSRAPHGCSPMLIFCVGMR